MGRWGVIAAAVLLMAPALSKADWFDNEYTKGHADVLAVGFEDGGLHLHFHSEGATINGVMISDAEFDPEEIFTRVPDSVIVSRPAGAEYDFIGVPAGSLFYRLPQSATAAALAQAPFAGIGTEELLEDGVPSFVGGSLTFSLTNVLSAPANGFFSLYQTPSDRFIDTADGSFANDSFLFPVGAHDHFNWAFTAPGIYQLEFTVSGVRADTSEFLSDARVYTFVVGSATAVPEASSLAMAGLALGAALVGLGVRRRRASD